MSLDITLWGSMCPCCGHRNYVGDFNITHNLAPLAKELNVYELLWLADEEIVPIEDALPLISAAVERLENENLSRFDSPNGWGTAEHFLNFLREIKESLETHDIERIDSWA